MAGLYLHIPFCRQACHYCNFHFSTSAADRQAVTDAMVAEIAMRKDYLQGEQLTSVYFGGGTPSLLSAQQLEQLFNSIHRHFIITPGAEITLEANPDDLTREKIAALKHTPVNRLSIGIQSFFDAHLRWMNRAHNAEQSIACIKDAQDAGFSNLSIDLIYGMPALTDEQWMQNMQTAIGFGIDHISSYALTVEANTALDHFIRHKKSAPVNEEQSARQFEMLTETLEQNGFEQYEISNFARNKKYAVHNTSYWKNEPYLGIGPSAHSFNKIARSWNVASNKQYVKGITQGEPSIETEVLTIENRVNEYLMTGLRTIWGCDLAGIERQFGTQYTAQLLPQVQQKVQEGLMEMNGTHFKLTRKARLLADGIAAGLFF